MGGFAEYFRRVEGLDPEAGQRNRAVGIEPQGLLGGPSSFGHLFKVLPEGLIAAFGIDRPDFAPSCFASGRHMRSAAEMGLGDDGAGRGSETGYLSCGDLKPENYALPLLDWNWQTLDTGLFIVK